MAQGKTRVNPNCVNFFSIDSFCNRFLSSFSLFLLLFWWKILRRKITARRQYMSNWYLNDAFGMCFNITVMLYISFSVTSSHTIFLVLLPLMLFLFWLACSYSYCYHSKICVFYFFSLAFSYFLYFYMTINTKKIFTIFHYNNHSFISSVESVIWAVEFVI